MTLRGRISLSRLVVCLSAGGLVSAGCSAPGDARMAPVTIRISTGSPTGNFRPFAEALVKGYTAMMPDLRVEAVDTPGSVRNLEELQEGTVDMGLAQAGLAYMAYNGRLREPGRPFRNIRGIAVLNSSPIQLLVGPRSKTRTVEELKGGRVGIGGRDGSGPAVTSELVLRGYFAPDEVEEVNGTVAQSTAMLLENTLDATFTISSVPNDEVRRQTEAGARLLHLRGPSVDRLRTTYPFFRSDIIPAGAYPGQHEPVQTLAVDVVLLARTGLDPAIVRRLTDGLFRMLPQLSSDLPFVKGMEPERAPATPVPLHPGAALYYRERELTR